MASWSASSAMRSMVSPRPASEPVERPGGQLQPRLAVRAQASNLSHDRRDRAFDEAVTFRVQGPFLYGHEVTWLGIGPGSEDVPESRVGEKTPDVGEHLCPV